MASPFLRSLPSKTMLTLPIACALVGAVLPFTALHHILGFTALPLAFFLILVGMVLAYLVLVELAKTRFYAVRPSPVERPTTRRQRFERRVVRRAAPFTRHVVSEPGRLLARLPGVGHRDQSQSSVPVRPNGAQRRSAVRDRQWQTQLWQA